ncbi:hypothetical protein HK104_001180 [Borealophlyctis nickersoniae]|nr:hypothetical protein HK104_001180 [Borealophlyctis nickersoniae]
MEAIASSHALTPSAPNELINPKDAAIDLLNLAKQAPAVERTYGFYRDFKRFVIQSRVLETGVGIIVGRAFQEVVRSFVNDVMIPPLTLITVNMFIVLRCGRSHLRWRTPEEAHRDGAVTINFGRFLHQAHASKRSRHQQPDAVIAHPMLKV